MCPVLCLNKYDEQHPCPHKSMLTSMRFKGIQPGLDLIILTHYIYNKHSYGLILFYRIYSLTAGSGQIGGQLSGQTVYATQGIKFNHYYNNDK